MSLVFLVILCFKNNEIFNIVFSFHSIEYVIVFLLVEVAFLIFPKSSINLIVLFIALLCAKESYLLVSQLMDFKSSNGHSLLSGSFNNPGPCGGYIAVCISLLVAYHVKYKDQAHNIINKILYWSTSIIAIVAFLILPSTQSRSAILAFGCGMVLLVFGTERIRTKITPFLKRYRLWLILGLIIIGTGAYLIKKPSADGRLFMDKISMQAIASNGMKGSGIGHFGGSYGNIQYDYFKKQIDRRGHDDFDWRAIKEHDRLTADCPDHAFNEYLYVGVEYGLYTMLIFIGIIVSCIVISCKRDSIWCYGLTAFAIFAFFSYPLHLWQFQVVLPILLAAAISDGDTSNSIKKLSEFVLLSITIVLLTFWVWRKIPEIKQNQYAETAWRKAIRWYEMEYYEYVVEDCDTLLQYKKHDEHYLFAYGQSLNKIGLYEKSDSILGIGTEISSDPMFWNVMGNNSLALGKYREAEERYKHAFYMVPNRLYPLYLLAKLYHTEGDTVRFLNMADKVEFFIPKVESANTERLRLEIRELKEEYKSE